MRRWNIPIQTAFGKLDGISKQRWTGGWDKELTSINQSLLTKWNWCFSFENTL